jgi:hypothetical protein
MTSLTRQAISVFARRCWFLPFLRLNAASALARVRLCESAGHHADAEVWLAALRTEVDRDRRLERAARDGDLIGRGVMAPAVLETPAFDEQRLRSVVTSAARSEREVSTGLSRRVALRASLVGCGTHPLRWSGSRPEER